MTLSEGIPGKKYEVIAVNVNEKVGRRLEALGLIHGTKAEVLNKKRNGTLIFKARGTRLAIGREISEGITVKEAATSWNSR
ncbi:FeoA family protein [Frisingicoccus sp.]|uniref:FeoA family protein n=1 Tax=Frisingicoccus sp. TaxID=1918627 RepID=UPI002E792C0F|nr:FeoA domain-containing protein [Frisingicoccus sp.]MEE0751308.1 FeoA domain-containing protein [Frisingicoccus sp.]